MATNRGFYVRSQQLGAALVEFTITFMVFLILILAIIEFALVIYDSSRLAEATRAAARYAIVNEPACDIFGKGSSHATGCTDLSGIGMACPDADPVSLRIESCDPSSETPECTMVKLMDQMMLRSNENSVLSGDGAVIITYRCSEVGDPEIPQFVPLVTVEAENIQHPMMFASIFGFYTPGGSNIGSTITLPRFETTRSGEDMYTQQPPASP